MTNSLPFMFPVDDNTFLVGCLIFFRVGAAIALLPVVGERTIPVRLRLIFAIAFSIVVIPAVFAEFDVETIRTSNVIYLMLAEIVAGLAIGISLRLFVHALQICGSIIAQSTSLSQLFGGAGTDPQPAIGHLLVVGGLALAVTFGLHVKMVELLIYSYRIILLGEFVAPTEFSVWGVAQIEHAFDLAFSLAGPFLIATIIYNIALGAINRAMPQLMVSFVGAPAITCGGLILLFIATPLMFAAWQTSINDFLASPFGMPP